MSTLVPLCVRATAVKRRRSILTGKIEVLPSDIIYFAVKHFIVGFYETPKKLMSACTIGEKIQLCGQLPSRLKKTEVLLSIPIYF